MNGEIRPGKKKFKKSVCSFIFWFLGKGFAACARYDSSIKAEIDSMPEGFTIMLKIEAFGPYMCLSKKDGRLKYMGLYEDKSAGIIISFKNIEAALLVLTGRIGIDRAYAEHRFTLKGDIAYGMSVVRCMYLVENYLFPGFITRNILKRMPAKQVCSLRIYLAALF